MAVEFQYAEWRAAYPESDDWLERAERARVALREAVLMAEANTSVGHQYFAMPHGWTHWAADAPHTTACSSVAKVEDWHG